MLRWGFAADQWPPSKEDFIACYKRGVEITWNLEMQFRASTNDEVEEYTNRKNCTYQVFDKQGRELES